MSSCPALYHIVLIFKAWCFMIHAVKVMQTGAKSVDK